MRGSVLYLILLGQTRSLTRNSTVKKMTTMLSIISMTNTTVGYWTLPAESCCIG